tara:strand:- start:12125 stop:12382 length:258 start_codon:yes stop_codon:yes gene_type:complete
MNKIQMLTVYDIKNKVVKEKRFFTSKRKANKSKDNITKILIEENNVNLDKVYFYDMLDLTMIDELYNISLTEFYIENQILTFKRV